MQDYMVKDKPHNDAIPLHLTHTLQKMHTWMRRRDIQVHQSGLAVLDLTRRLIFPIDLVAEMNQEIVFILLYYSEKRGGAASRDMQDYADEVADTCRRHYRINPVMGIINVYGNGSIVGALCTYDAD